MRTFVVLALVLCLAIMPVAVCQAEEKGLFDDWYGMLEAQFGTTYEFDTSTARPYAAGKWGGWKEAVFIVGTEFDVDSGTEEKGPVTALLGATYNLGNLKDYGVDVSWAEHFGFNVGLCLTYGWVEDTPTEGWGWRGSLSVVDLSFSDGGAKEQRER